MFIFSVFNQLFQFLLDYLYYSTYYKECNKTLQKIFFLNTFIQSSTEFRYQNRKNKL